MKFGLSFLPDAEDTTKPAQIYYADALVLARIADAGGLHSVKMTEHYLHPYGGYCPNPLQFLAAVAACTEKLRLMTGCILPVFHHPVRLAAEIAMTDALSGGRLDIGFGRAFSAHEFDAFGLPVEESRERFEATLGAVLRLLTEDVCDIDTPFHSVRAARSLPRPLQAPCPPVWVAAAKSRQSFAWAGEQGFDLLTALAFLPRQAFAEQLAVYREARADSGHPGRGRIAVLIPLCIAEDMSTALSIADHHYDRYRAVWADAARYWSGRGSHAYPGYGQMVRNIGEHSAAQLDRMGNVAFGTPAKIADYVLRLAEEVDVDQVLWNIDFGAMPLVHAERTLRLFIDRVRPMLPGQMPRESGTNRKVQQSTGS